MGMKTCIARLCELVLLSVHAIDKQLIDVSHKVQFRDLELLHCLVHVDSDEKRSCLGKLDNVYVANVAIFESLW